MSLTRDQQPRGELGINPKAGIVCFLIRWRTLLHLQTRGALAWSREEWATLAGAKGLRTLELPRFFNASTQMSPFQVIGSHSFPVRVLT